MAALSVNELTNYYLRGPLKIVDWISETFDNNFGIKNDFYETFEELLVKFSIIFLLQIFFSTLLLHARYHQIVRLF